MFSYPVLATLIDNNFPEERKSAQIWMDEFAQVLDSLEHTQHTRVAVLAEKSACTISFLYTAFHKNFVYVPVDVQAPVERIEGILNQLEPQYFFVQKKYAQAWQQMLANVKMVWQNDHFFIGQKSSKSSFVNPDGLAYMLFTSGSTGLPKGVMLSKQNATCFVDWMASTFNITKNTVVLSVAPLHFDLSVFDIFVTAKAGSTLIIPAHNLLMNPMHLAECIATQNVNTIYATPTWFTLLVQYGKLKRYDFAQVTTILIAGEALKVSLVNTLQMHFPNARISNLYGPTETNVCTYYHVPSQNIAQQNGVVSVGNVCPYASARVNNNNVLEVSGESVMIGYWPASIDQTWYNTGDVVSYDTIEKVYYYMGRADRMIKRNGYRIEPAEIETMLLQHSNIAHVAVTAHVVSNKLEIWAHYTSKNNNAINDLHQFCANALPHYMVPDKFLLHSQLPLTSSGKVDYNTLSTM